MNLNIKEAIKRKLRIVRCVLFHEKETKRFEWMMGPFHFDDGDYKGCRKCDIWRKL